MLWKCILFGLGIIWVSACSPGDLPMTEKKETTASYLHAPSVKFFRSNSLDPQFLHGSEEDLVVVTASVSNDLNRDYKVWVVFYSVVTGQKLIIENVSFLSQDLNIEKEINREFSFESKYKNIFKSSLLAFETLPKEKLPSSAKKVTLVVNYKLKGKSYTKEFNFSRHEQEIFLR